MKHRPTVVIIGAGHAGIEAARAAAACGATALVVTHSRDRIGELSCNPAIGGLGKSHLVSEIDALGGLMGRLGDSAGIHYRLLNRSKGPATQGTRVQVDRALYRRAASLALLRTRNVRVVEAAVVDLVVKSGRMTGVVLASGGHIECHAAVVTTGTFLGGMIHVGTAASPGGRHGDAPATALASRFRGLGLPMGRLKTGTPPRLARTSIAWEALPQQHSDKDPVMLSLLNHRPRRRQIACAMTATNERTHSIIRGNLHTSAVHGGNVTGRGPRYCPSIEDKIVRFADRERHQIFLEPEGLDSPLVYPNGISTSLPAHVQVEYVRTIEGLERAEIVRPGYAIEYDYLDPRSLDSSLALKSLQALYFAGQVNGTTGYEEAAAQGLVAGTNAARFALGEPPLRLSRRESMIGVMIDDLTSRGVTEPYRMFTSRAEARLSLRPDNADFRLTARGHAYGLVSDRRLRMTEARRARLDAARSALADTKVSPQQASALGLPSVAERGSRTILSLAASGLQVPFEALSQVDGVADLTATDRRTLVAEALYANHIERQLDRWRAVADDERICLPAELDYVSMSGLSLELRDKLARVAPANLAQAARIEGMTPAALVLIAGHAQRSAARRT